jgi:hypothetical protein
MSRATGSIALISSLRSCRTRSQLRRWGWTSSGNRVSSLRNDFGDESPKGRAVRPARSRTDRLPQFLLKDTSGTRRHPGPRLQVQYGRRWALSHGESRILRITSGALSSRIGQVERWGPVQKPWSCDSFAIDVQPQVGKGRESALPAADHQNRQHVRARAAQAAAVGAYPGRLDGRDAD